MTDKKVLDVLSKEFGNEDQAKEILRILHTLPEDMLPQWCREIYYAVLADMRTGYI